MFALLFRQGSRSGAREQFWGELYYLHVSDSTRVVFHVFGTPQSSLGLAAVVILGRGHQLDQKGLVRTLFWKESYSGARERACGELLRPC